MRAVAMLGKQFYLRARFAVASIGSVALRAGTPDFIDAVVRGSADVAIVDPLLVARDLEVTAALVRAHLGTIIYMRLTPDYAQAALTLLRDLGSGEIVAYEYNDDPRAFSAAIVRQSRAFRGRLLLRGLESRLPTLPPIVHRAVSRVNERGDRIDSINRLAAVCGVSRRTVLRDFQHAGISSAGGFVAGLTLLRNYDTLVDRGVSPVRVARSIGLSSERALRKRCLDVSGSTLDEIRAPMPIEDFAGRIAGVITAPQSGS